MGRARHYASNAERQAAYRQRRAHQILHQIPHVQGEGYAVYQGDALACVPALAPCDHVLTDPPYEPAAHTRTRRTRAVLEGRAPYGAIPFAPITDAQRAFVARLPCGWRLIFCQVEAVASYQALLGTTYIRTIIWEKPDGAPQFTGDRPAMGYETIVCAWARPGRPCWNAGGKRGVYIHDVRDGHPRVHPTQKPIPLLKALLRDFTQPGEVILDPFMGSGSVGVACLETGRRFVGVEIDPAMFAVACQRLQTVERQGTLFAAS